MLNPNSGVPSYLQTRALEDGARHAQRPERFIMLLAIDAADRRAVEAEALDLMFKYGGSYIETLRTVVTRYIKANNRKETSWIYTNSSTGRTLGSGGTGRQSAWR